MKIVLDLTKLLEEWKITKEEYDKFSGLAKKKLFEFCQIFLFDLELF